MHGPCIPALIQAHEFDTNSGKPVRLPITDVVKTRAGATAVGGKLEAGALRVNFGWGGR